MKMSDTNLSLVLHGKCDLKLEERPVQEPGRGQVQLSMRRVGICGSDVHLWQTGCCGPFVMEGQPTVLGHEGSAVVTKLGEGVTGLKVGDRIAIEPATPCRLCSYCTGGRYNLCPDIKGLACPGIDGHITRTFVHAADCCHKLPHNVSFEEGAAVEPLSVCVHVTARAGIKMGHVVLITGAGPIGVLGMLVSKARGCKKVCLTDISESRLDFAKKLGADHVINVKGKDLDTVAKEAEIGLGDPIDVTLECSGTHAGILTAIKATRPGGAIVAVGFSPDDMAIPLKDVTAKELDIRGSLRYMNSFSEAISLLANKQVDVTPLFTHHFPLEQSPEAFQLAHEGKGIKIIINCEKGRESA